MLAPSSLRVRIDSLTGLMASLQASGKQVGDSCKTLAAELRRCWPAVSPELRPSHAGLPLEAKQVGEHLAQLPKAVCEAGALAQSRWAARSVALQRRRARRDRKPPRQAKPLDLHLEQVSKQCASPRLHAGAVVRQAIQEAQADFYMLCRGMKAAGQPAFGRHTIVLLT